MRLAAARFALGSAGATVVLLALLHIVSPEFAPSWRMVSEYANGDHAWLLTLLFLSWAVSSWALAYALQPIVQTKAGKIGLVFLVLAGVGEAMAAAFDVNHPLHDMAGNIGIASLPVAALLISRSLGQHTAWKGRMAGIKGLAHATWLSVVLLIISFAVLMTTYVQSGGDLSAGAEITTLPDGVIAVVGWANRLLLVVYCAWVALVAARYTRARQ
jgi:hypothetical protein